jgi:T4 RnlA family RNA ligase
MNLYEIGLPDSEQFNLKDCVIGGDDCFLIIPKDMSVKWNEQNKYFRSSIWRKSDGKLISAGFRKFVNYGEQPDFEPLVNNSKLKVLTKLDGSLLIASSHNNELIIRTRGTVDATNLENGSEIEFLKNKYPKVFSDYFLISERFTLLFEWTTPSNRIVLQESEEPTLWLIGIVDNNTYEYLSQDVLDFHAKTLEVERPKTYTFDLTDVEVLKREIEPLKDIEGVVIYDESGQILKKIKTLRYLELHKVFTGIKSVDHLFDLFVEYGCTYRENFEALLAINFDWELVATLKPLTDQLYQKWQDIKNKLNWIALYFNNPDFIELDRKGKAQKINEYFSGYTGIAFAILDNKEIPPHKLWNSTWK